MRRATVGIALDFKYAFSTSIFQVAT